MLTQFKLKNKLKVLLVESHKAPVVAVQMWVKTGSADEKKGEEGISHFIEHLVFKGTRKYGVGEIAKTVEGSGGELNAYTTFDQTVFHVTLSKEYLDVGLDCISEMMGFPRFDPVEIDRERGVVLEEIKRSFDNPHQVATRQLFEAVFKKHPYGIPVIGYEKNIETVKPKTLSKYFNSRYVTTNMTLVVAGDFEQREIKKNIENYFGQYKTLPLKKVSRKKEPVQNKAQTSYLKADFKEASVNFAFKIPPAKHPDVPALDVLGYILGQGDSSRLVRRLRLEKPLVVGVSAGTYNPVDAGIFAIGASLRGKNLNRVVEVINEELEKLLTSPPDAAELARAQLNLEAEEVYSLETVDGLANKVGMFQTFLNDPEYVQKYLRQVQKLKPEDMLKVARKYLRPKNMAATLMVGDEDSKEVTESNFKDIVSGVGKNLEKSLKTKPVKVKERRVTKTKALTVPLSVHKNESKIIKHRLPNGALVIIKRNPEVPIVHLKAGFLGGLRIENPEHLGASFLLSNTWTSGTKKYAESEIAGITEGFAATVSAFGGRNSVGLTMESLKVHENAVFDIFRSVMLEPTFQQAAIEREAHIQLEHLRTRADHPSALAVQTFMETIFKGHPYAFDTLGTESSIRNLNTEAIINYYSKMVNANNTVLVAVGDVKPEEQIKVFENLTSQLRKGEKLNRAFSLAALQRDERIFTKSDKEQTHIIVGYRSVSFTDPDRYTLQVLQAVLAGQGGRLFIELRDKASLAYTVAPIHLEGIETGYFGVYIACSPEKGKLAVKMIHQELEKVISQAPSENEVERAKKYLIGRNHIDLQKNAVQASSILFDELYGVDSEETFRFSEHLHGITAQDVQRVARRILDQTSVSVAVGPVEPW